MKQACRQKLFDVQEGDLCRLSCGCWVRLERIAAESGFCTVQLKEGCKEKVTMCALGVLKHERKPGLKVAASHQAPCHCDPFHQLLVEAFAA